MVFMGHLEAPAINLDEIQQRLSRPDYAPVAESLYEIGVTSIVDLLSNYAGQNADLGAWSAGADINRDVDLRLQYLGGWGINSTHGRHHLPADSEIPAGAARPVPRLSGKGGGAHAGHRRNWKLSSQNCPDIHL